MSKKFNSITFEYSFAVDADELDDWGEQQLWNESYKASEKFRMSLIQFWSMATPKRREKAKANREQLGL